MPVSKKQPARPSDEKTKPKKSSPRPQNKHLKRGGPGRPKGVPNKLSRLAKDNIASVFDAIGGTDKMAEWAEENLTEFYKIYARLVPVQVQGDDENPIAVKDVTQKVLSMMTPEQLEAARLAAMEDANNAG